MNTTSVFVVLTGLFVRLVLPLAVTALVVYLLHRLDVRWQAEAEKERATLVKDDLPCWKEQGLSVDEIKMRAAKNDQPCWQTHRLVNGYLREACFDCEVFLSAPIPAPVHSHIHS
jgi:hypothetical protein